MATYEQVMNGAFDELQVIFETRNKTGLPFLETARAVFEAKGELTARQQNWFEKQLKIHKVVLADYEEEPDFKTGQDVLEDITNITRNEHEAENFVEVEVTENPVDKLIEKLQSIQLRHASEIGEVIEELRGAPSDL